MRQVNLIPKDLRRSVFAKAWGSYAVKITPMRVCIALVVVFCVVSLYQRTQVWRYQSLVGQSRIKLKRLQSDLAKAKADFVDLVHQRETITHRMDAVLERKNFLAAQIGDRNDISRILVALSDLIPEGLWVTGITADKESFKIVGKTTDEQRVSALMLNMDKSGYFKETAFSYTHKEARQGEGFLTGYEISSRIVKDKLQDTEHAATAGNH